MVINRKKNNCCNFSPNCPRFSGLNVRLPPIHFPAKVSLPHCPAFSKDRMGRCWSGCQTDSPQVTPVKKPTSNSQLLFLSRPAVNFPSLKRRSPSVCARHCLLPRSAVVRLHSWRQTHCARARYTSGWDENFDGNFDAASEPCLEGASRRVNKQYRQGPV